MGATKSYEFTSRENKLARYAKALGHPARVAILKLLAGRQTCVCGDIVDELPLSQSTVSQHLKELKEAGLIRGEIEGGLCIRRVEPFVAESERRYFVLDGRPFSATGDPVPELVSQVARRIPSPFFSIDVIRREDGVLRLVEIGDGQVSDLVGWSTTAFAEMWAAMRPDR